MQGRISTTLLLITSAIALLIAYGQRPAGAATPVNAAAPASTRMIATEGGENPGQALRIDLTLRVASGKAVPCADPGDEPIRAICQNHEGHELAAVSKLGLVRLYSWA